jgi:hypothetical protein
MPPSLWNRIFLKQLENKRHIAYRFLFGNNASEESGAKSSK